MEYMRLEGVLGGAVSKLINKGIAEKLGYRPGINIDEFKLYTDTKDNGNQEIVKANLTVTMTQEDFNKLIEEATK